MPKSPETDDALLALARAGDPQAFGRLVERYEARVAATIIGMLGPGPEADDVGQETFIRFYRHLDAYRGDAALGTYLTRIAINQSLKALKRRQSWTRRFFFTDDVDALPAPSDVDAPPTEARERAALVQAALARLTPEHRAVVVLRMLEEYSTRETAALLDLPEGTVMSRLKRALARLEGLLDPLLR